MGWIGSLIGSAAGGLGGAFAGKPAAGAQLGHDFGQNFIPFKTGGKMKSYKQMLTARRVPEKDPKTKKRKFQKGK